MRKKKCCAIQFEIVFNLSDKFSFDMIKCLTKKNIKGRKSLIYTVCYISTEWFISLRVTKKNVSHV